MKPWRRLRLAHAEPAPMQQLRGVLREGDQDKQQAVFRCWQRTVFIGGIAAPLPLPSMEGPVSHVVQEGCLKRGSQRCTLVDGQARQISHVGRRG
jgi:hypothetical protein